MCLWRLRPMLTQIMREGLRVANWGSGRVRPKPSFSSNAACESNPFELPIQVIPGKNQRGGPAVRAMVLVLGQMPLGEKRVDFPIRKPIAELHRGLAGDHVEQLVEQIPCVRLPAAHEQLFDQIP